MRTPIEILQAAASGALPDSIREGSGIDMDVFYELYKAGFIDAKNACCDDGDEYLFPKITSSGRSYLSGLTAKPLPWWKSFDRRISVIATLISVLALAATLGLLSAK